MSFTKFTQAEKVEAVTPAQNAQANETKRVTGSVRLADVQTCPECGSEHFPDCACIR